VEYEKSLLESEGRTGLEIVCKKCHSPICTFMDSKPAGAVESEPEKRRLFARSAECHCRVGSMALMRLMCCAAPSVTHCSSVGRYRVLGREGVIKDLGSPQAYGEASYLWSVIGWTRTFCTTVSSVPRKRVCSGTVILAEPRAPMGMHTS